MDPKFPDGGHCQSVLRRQWLLLLPPSMSGQKAPPFLRDMRATRGTPPNVEEQRNESLFFSADYGDRTRTAGVSGEHAITTTPQTPHVDLQFITTKPVLELLIY